MHLSRNSMEQIHQALVFIVSVLLVKCHWHLTEGVQMTAQDPLSVHGQVVGSIDSMMVQGCWHERDQEPEIIRCRHCQDQAVQATQDVRCTHAHTHTKKNMTNPETCKHVAPSTRRLRILLSWPQYGSETTDNVDSGYRRGTCQDEMA